MSCITRAIKFGAPASRYFVKKTYDPRHGTIASPQGPESHQHIEMETIVGRNESSARKFQWNTIIWVSLFHLFSAVALFYISWQNIAITLVLLWLSVSPGIGLGYHRLLTHRGFKTPRWVERTLAAFGTLALQSGPVSWVTTHRIHHAFTETENDPHSPERGLFWAHIGWIFRGAGNTPTRETMERYSPDLVKDPVLMFLDKFYWAQSILLGVILWLAFGLEAVLWGVFVRTVLGWHITWLVNSATHTWGSRRFDTRDSSTNSLIIGLLAFGEGWHNNHHAHPRSSRHGLTWKEFDFNWIQIKIMRMLRLAKDVYAFDIKSDAVNSTKLNKSV